jgi:hypothetical protein
VYTIAHEERGARTFKVPLPWGEGFRVRARVQVEIRFLKMAVLGLSRTQVKKGEIGFKVPLPKGDLGGSPRTRGRKTRCV